MLSFGFEAKKNTIDIPTVSLFLISLICSWKNKKYKTTVVGSNPGHGEVYLIYNIM
jgi:hypothetical protein